MCKVTCFGKWMALPHIIILGDKQSLCTWRLQYRNRCTETFWSPCIISYWNTVCSFWITHMYQKLLTNIIINYKRWKENPRNHYLHKEKSNTMQKCVKILLFHIYMKLTAFWATHRPSSGAWNCAGSLWFFICGRLVDVVRCAWCPPTTRPSTFHVWKTRGCQCNFRLLMMGDVSPETWWASYKYGIIKFWHIVASCWIFFNELYYGARIHEHQITTYFIT
jgi:hypothetical protein